MTAPALPAAERYQSEAIARLRSLLDTQRAALDRAAILCSQAIAADGLVHLCGVGHSRMLCEEMTPRQGCPATPPSRANRTPPACRSTT